VCLYNCTHFLCFILGSGELLEKVGKSGVSAVTTTPEYNLLLENYDKIVSILCQSSDPSTLAERLHSAQLIFRIIGYVKLLEKVEESGVSAIPL